MAIDTLRNAVSFSLNMVYSGLSYAAEVVNDLKPLATASMQWAYSTASTSLGAIGSCLPSVFTGEGAQKTMDFAVRFFTSSDPSFTWGAWQIPTFSVLQDRSGDMAFVGITTYATAKLGLYGLQNIYAAAQRPLPTPTHPLASHIQRLGVFIKGSAQLGIAGLAAYTFYYHTDNHKRVTDLFLSTIKREI